VTSTIMLSARRMRSASRAVRRILLGSAPEVTASEGDGEMGRFTTSRLGDREPHGRIGDRKGAPVCRPVPAVNHVPATAPHRPHAQVETKRLLRLDPDESARPIARLFPCEHRHDRFPAFGSPRRKTSARTTASLCSVSRAE
jgi:hypothetical protein